MTILTMAGAISVKEERHNEEMVVKVRSRRGTEYMSRCSLKKLNIAAVARKANEIPAHVPSANDTNCPSNELYVVNAMKYRAAL